MAFILMNDFHFTTGLVHIMICVNLKYFLYSQSSSSLCRYRYQQLLLCGLIFSCIGDALLDYKKGALFEFGIISFAGEY